MQRTLQDYLLILRERIWYVVVVFLIVFSSSLVYTLSETKIYQASASLQILRNDTNVIEVQQVVDNDIRSDQDLNTQLKLLESASMAEAVAKRMSEEERRTFLAPYGGGTDVAAIAGYLVKDRKVAQRRGTMFVDVTYRHPDRHVAARVANLYVREYLEYNSNQQTREAEESAAKLDKPEREYRERVEKLQKDLLVLREKNGDISLDDSKNVVGEAFKVASQRFMETGHALSAIETRQKQIQEFQKREADLTELPFIASLPTVNQLRQKVADAKVELAALEKRYKAKHPSMVRTLEVLGLSQTLLKAEIETVCRQFESEYQTALKNHAVAKDELDRRQRAVYELDRLRVEYRERERELNAQEEQLKGIIARKTEIGLISTVVTQNARAIDPAIAPGAGSPAYPRVSFNLGMGVLGGLGLGLVFAFFVAFIDDRVKSSFDIEGVVGLPLIGIIPQIKRMEQPDKAQIVVNNADRQVAEAFLALHSSLRLKDESKNAKLILTTSTIPGEGKSFTTTNLALTFAAHGERVAIVDCDLRKPNIHKSFRMENIKGVIDVVAGKATIDDVVVKGPTPNLDIIPTGGRAKNPTQILNSKGFELMLSDLRKRYDRVFIDTPPLAAVSDALIILPLVDGSLFTIYFNKVRRKAAQFAAKRLTEANVPNFGAVLNGLNLAVSGYYYAQYYDKSYKDYYVVMSKDEDSKER